MRKVGVKEGTRVAVCVEQAVSLVVGALGVLKAGGTLVPLERNEPVGRMRWMLEDAGVAVVVTEEGLRERFGETAAKLVVVDGKREWKEESGEDWGGRMEAADGVACILYRSSRKGRPEGILISHRGLSGVGFGGECGIEAADHVGLSLNFQQEGSCLEMFRTLAAGACVVEVGRGGALPPRKLAALLREQAVTVLWASAAVVERVAREFPWALKKLRMMICEESVEVLQHLRESLKSEVLERVYGCYGVSEAGGRQIMYPLRAVSEPFPAIGREYGNQGTKFYVLDSALELVGEGMVGELYLGGEMLGLGYEGGAWRTAETFVPDAFFPGGGRLYRTGTLARWRADGSLEDRGQREGGRVIGGVRVEAEEIEEAHSYTV